MRTPLAYDNVHCLPCELEAPHVGLVLICRQVFTNPVHLDVETAIRAEFENGVVSGKATIHTEQRRGARQARG
jgi:hypothetical protein